MKRIFAFALLLCLTFTLTACLRINAPALPVLPAKSDGVPSEGAESHAAEPIPSEAAEIVLLTRDDWEPCVRSALNGLLTERAFKNDYVVTDFDNTACVFDVEVQVAYYQLEVMAFAVTPDELDGVLTAGLTKDYTARIADIEDAYAYLYETYGPFTAKGVDPETETRMKEDPYWLEFATKMWKLYSRLSGQEKKDAVYPWLLYWFTGMTPDEVYTLSTQAYTRYGTVETSSVTWKTPGGLPSREGPQTVTWTAGVSVTENVKELWRALTADGIDVWVCSASGLDPVRAAVDFFGLHDGCRGVLALTVATDENGRYLPAYDYEKAGAVTTRDGWEADTVPIGAVTAAEGKVTAIDNVLRTRYGKGPAAGFMDSTGDFDFCTEYASLRLVVCFNRADRKLTDGGGLIAAVAVYQGGLTLEDTARTGDTLYVLQGRDENGQRTLRPSQSTVRFGKTEPVRFASQDHETLLGYITERGMSIKEVLDTFCLSVSASDSPIGVKTGFLSAYNGYHSKE